MGNDGRAIFQRDVEHQSVAGDRQIERIRAALVATRTKRVLLEQIVDRDRALMLDVRIGAPDRAFVEVHPDQAIWVGHRHRRLSRSATERACALSPSASPSAIAAGPISASCSAPHLRMDVRFMKSSTPRPEEKRAERAVGSTWLEPAT